MGNKEQSVPITVQSVPITIFPILNKGIPITTLIYFK